MAAAILGIGQCSVSVLAEAERRADALNNTATVEAGDELLASWGGSA